MRIYVAAKSEEAVRARKFMDRFEHQEAQAHRAGAITYDWTKDVLAHEDAPFTRDELRKCAHADVEAACSADALVVLYHPKLRGALVEVGAALALENPVIAVGVPPEEACVFFHLCQHVSSEDEALDLLKKMADERAS